MEKSKIRRICFFAGPGSGKSSCAAYIYSQLKKIGCSVEFVQEYVKSWTFENRAPSSFDQLYLLAKQIRMEDLILRNNVDLVVTDSPVAMSTCYAKKYGFGAWKSLIDLAHEFEKTYPSLNIFMDRGDVEYITHGRFQTKEEAKEMDNVILDYLRHHTEEFHVVGCRDWDKITSLIIQEINMRQ